MYDAVADAVPMVQQGRHRKKALVLISDGNDTASWADLMDVRRAVRETEVLVYAVGIEEQDRATGRRRSRRPRNPFPFPGRRGSGSPFQLLSQYPRATARHWNGERLNVTALREITDDSGGRTEIVLEVGDVDRATSSIADELSRQVLPRICQPGTARRTMAHDPGGRRRSHAPRPGAARIRRFIAIDLHSELSFHLALSTLNFPRGTFRVRATPSHLSGCPTCDGLS